jgi:hypothetical protein
VNVVFFLLRKAYIGFAAAKNAGKNMFDLSVVLKNGSAEENVSAKSY